ncbi:hypothetical protein AMJ87_09180 [candidate division WOR_3 bacterium SM23_60]|uniref:DUF2520 domain-containing protein n=1 Tax=candidate division WOR_3 bacterium SM23_60 TaxID=1703780 RepID=A0A0S8GBM5_UNCW3|nr:MAG: hypothetical protein AMJ87_09180 [candidate division WOR_3 bacterium SM23_60]
MKIGLIGCGKVGTSIFYYLSKYNSVVGVYDTNNTHEKRTARLLHVKENPPLEELCRTSTALFFATPDDETKHAYNSVRRFIKGKKYLFHFSGLLPAAVFPKARSVYRASVHPFATFPQLFIPPARRHYMLFLEGDQRAVKSARAIFDKKHFTLKTINTKRKMHYHTLGVFSSNFVVGLFSAMRSLANRLEWTEQEMYDVVFPMIEETLENIKLYGSKGALSGPLVRGDAKTIRRHLRALKQDSRLADMYKALSLQLLEAVVKGKNKDIKKILSSKH